MKSKSFYLLIIMILTISIYAFSNGISINFPTIPNPPAVVQAPTPQAGVGADTEVRVLLRGQMQLEVGCPENKPDCESEEYVSKPDPSISINPPQIVKAMVYYYIGTELKEDTNIESINLTKSDETKCKEEFDGKEYTCYWWVGTIPTESKHKLTAGTTVSYMIAASDDRGNTLSFLPDITNGPGFGTNWAQKFATLPIKNLEGTTSYDECGTNKTGSICSKFQCTEANGLNDPVGDTCGPSQTITSIPHLDIKGLSIGGNADLIFVKDELQSWNPEGNKFVQILLNVLMGKDSNIKDIVTEKTFGIVYAPELSGAYQAVSLALFDVHCATDGKTPTEQIIEKCRIPDTTSQIAVEKAGGIIYFKVNRKGKAKYGSYNLLETSIDTTNKGYSRAVVGTANVDITGEEIPDYFYIVDITPGLSVYERPKTFTIQEGLVKCPTKMEKVEILGNTSCSDTSKVSCKIQWTASGTSGAKYNVYSNTTFDVSGATKLATELTALNYEHKDLSKDGTTYYYWVSAVKDKECEQGAWVTGQCSVPDCEAPAPPTNVTAETCVVGYDDKAELRWSHDGKTPGGKTDSSLYGFYVDYKYATSTEWLRANPATPVMFQSGTTDYNYLLSGLSKKGNYDFKITAVDVGNLTASSDKITATLKDCKPPDTPKNLLLSYNVDASVCGTKLSWDKVEEEEVTITYNVWKCKGTAQGQSSNCFTGETATNWTKITSSPITKTTHETEGEAEDFTECCYYISALDNETPPNESEKPTTEVKCLECCYNPPDTNGPNAPEGFTITPEPQGKELKLEWTTVYSGGEGSFTEAESPGAQAVVPIEISGYRIKMGLNESQIDKPCGTVIWKDSAKTSYKVTQCEDGTKLANGTKYCFTVQAFDAKFNNSPLSKPACETPKDIEAPEPPSPSQITILNKDTTMGIIKIGWIEIIDNNDKCTYEIYRCDEGVNPAPCNSESNFSKIATITQTGQLDYQDEDLTVGNYYTYCIIPVDPSGNKKSLSEVVSLDTECKRHELFSDAPGCPKTVTALSTADRKSAQIYWDAVTDAGGGTKINGYNIYQCTTTNLNSCTKKMNSTLQQQHTPTNPYITSESKSGTFYYTVTAVNDKDVESNILSCPLSDPVVIVLGCEAGTYCISGKIETIGGVTIDTKLKITAVFDGKSVGEASLGADGSFQVGVNSCVKGGNCPTGRIVSSPGNTTDVEFYITNCIGTGFFCTKDDTLGGKKFIGKKPISDLPATPDPSTPLQVTLEKIYKGLCAGDADKDGKVGINDLSKLKKAYGSKDLTCNQDCAVVGTDCADFDKDGKVGINDLSILKKNYGTSEIK